MVTVSPLRKAKGCSTNPVLGVGLCLLVGAGKLFPYFCRILPQKINKSDNNYCNNLEHNFDMVGTFYPLLVMAKVWLPVAFDRLGSERSAGFVFVLAHNLSSNPHGMHTYLVRGLTVITKAVSLG